MPGPVPKPPEQRRRRNRVDQVMLAAQHDKPFPPLPQKYPGGAFCAATVAWYEACCRSPMAAQWCAVDYIRLQDVAIVRDLWFRTGSLKALQELRLQEACFGLTPADRRRLGVTIEPDASGDVVKLPPRRPRRIRAVAPAE